MIRHEMILNIILNGLFCLASQEAIGIQYSTVQYSTVKFDSTRLVVTPCLVIRVRYGMTRHHETAHIMRW
jgi:hypothetical protein